MANGEKPDDYIWGVPRLALCSKQRSRVESLHWMLSAGGHAPPTPISSSTANPPLLPFNHPRPSPPSPPYALSTTNCDVYASLRGSLLLHIHWVPGREDISESDWADSEAKAAARGSTFSISPRLKRLLSPLPPSSAAALVEGKRATTTAWPKHGAAPLALES